jgi:rod shape-determining protein MreC
MSFFYRHKTLTIIAAILIALIVIIIASYALRNSGSFIGGAARTVVSFVEKPVGAAFKAVGGAIGGIFSDEDIAAENKRLTERTEKLEKELLIERLNTEELNELRALEVQFSGSGAYSEERLVSANVVSYDGSNTFNIFTVDVGTEAGVERNTVVISGFGLVGRVLDAGPGWARVSAAIDESNNVGFTVDNSGAFIGVLRGDGSGDLTGEFLDENATAKEGDGVFTSGTGGIYPAGIFIGTITEAKLSKDSPLLGVTVKPATNFKALRKVGLLI